MIPILTGVRWYLIVFLIGISLIISDVEHLLICLLATSILFRKMLLSSSANFLIQFFVFLMLSCISCLCMLDINPLSVISFPNIFCHSVGCLWFSDSFLHCVKACRFNQVPFVCFCFYFLCFRRQIQKRFYDLYQSVLLTYSSMSFMVPDLTLRSLIHFEFIFVNSIRECSNFILLHKAIWFSQDSYFRYCAFFIVYSCLLVIDLLTIRAWIYSWIVLFHWSMYVSVLMTATL